MKDYLKIIPLFKVPVILDIAIHIIATFVRASAACFTIQAQVCLVFAGCAIAGRIVDEFTFNRAAVIA
jgi:hypothetical protein